MRPFMGGPSGKKVAPANGYWMASPTVPDTSSAPLLPLAPPSTSFWVACELPPRISSPAAAQPTPYADAADPLSNPASSTTSGATTPAGDCAAGLEADV